jgi:DNA-binding NtrC family response regulator
MAGGTGASGTARDVFLKLNLIGDSSAFCQALRLVEKFGSVEAPTLIQGETGTGKELAARALHYFSRRRDFAFVPVNCGALPDTLLESELFGHERGAFTDARRSHLGLVAGAQGGTLFLDEVEALSPRAQVVLLRFLQNQEYRPVGATAVKVGDARVVAASNVNLYELVKRQLFRSDLLFRFGVLNITMPPLRKREDDAIILAHHFLDTYCLQYRQPHMHLTESAVARLRRETWPGNVRELQNLILSEFLLADPGAKWLHLDSEATDEPAQTAGEPFVFKTAKARAIADFERAWLSDLFAHTAGNVSLAARLSHKDRSALNRMARKYGLAGHQFRLPFDLNAER